jgi:hypothetical protein
MMQKTTTFTTILSCKKLLLSLHYDTQKKCCVVFLFSLPIIVANQGHSVFYLHK